MSDKLHMIKLLDVTVNLNIIFVEYFQEREKYAKMQEKLKN